MNADFLAKWQQQLYSRKPLIASRERRNAAQALIQDGSPLAWHALVQAILNSDRRISTDVLSVLEQRAQEGELTTREKLCQLVIEYEQPMARQMVVAAGYAPRDPCLRAIFYFLSEQWEQYEDLDFDHSLLRAALASHQSLRRRVAQKAKQARRVEWVHVVTGINTSQQTELLAKMTVEEWEAVVELLHQSGQCAQMWELAQVVPAVWSVRLLAILKEVGWEARGERPGFVELEELASKCIGGQPILSGITSCRATLPGDKAVSSLAITPDGQLLITGSDAIRLWRLSDGALMSSLEGHTKRIRKLAISPNSKILASASLDKTIRLWQLPEGTPLVTLKAHRASIYSLLITPDSQLLIGGFRDGTVQLWRLDGTPFKTLKGHKGEVNCLAVSPDGKLLASGSWDYTIRLWRLSDGKLLASLKEHTDDISCLRITPDGTLLISGSWDKTIRLWRLPDGKALQTLKGHSRQVMSLAISPDGKLLASGSRGNRIRLWSLPDGEGLNTLKRHIGSVMTLAISPDGGLLTSGGLDNLLCLWQLPHGTLLSTLKEHKQEITSLAISPDGRLLASASRDKTVRLWTSELNRLSHFPVDQLFERNVWIRNALENLELVASDRSWLEFFSGVMRWQQRYDIELEEIEEETLEIGEFDIEIEIEG
jgi:WD40 repeat protein